MGFCSDRAVVPSPSVRAAISCIRATSPRCASASAAVSRRPRAAGGYSAAPRHTRPARLRCQCVQIEPPIPGQPPALESGTASSALQQSLAPPEHGADIGDQVAEPKAMSANFCASQMPRLPAPSPRSENNTIGSSASSRAHPRHRTAIGEGKEGCPPRPWPPPAGREKSGRSCHRPA